MEALDNALPGGGTTSSYGGAHFYATKKLSKTVSVEAEHADRAEQIARNVMQEGIDPERFSGWTVTKTSEPEAVDS